MGGVNYSTKTGNVNFLFFSSLDEFANAKFIIEFHHVCLSVHHPYGTTKLPLGRFS